MKKRIIESDPVNPVNPVKDKKAIEIWKKLIDSDCNLQEIQVQMKDIYRNNYPQIAEIIMNSHCPGRCLHCIYASDYEQYNRNMNWEEWKVAFHNIYEKLGLKRFIFDGRAISKECIQAIRFLKLNFPDVKVGLIADGISLEPFVEDLIDCPPDWLDISVDGLEKDHDRQRNLRGSHKKTLDTLIQLKESDAFERINILTCLTTLNINSVTGMIRRLNALGFKNFFITPMSILQGYRPDPALQPDEEAFIRWLDELLETAIGLADAWLEVDIYDGRYAAALKKLKPELFQAFGLNHDHLEIVKRFKDNEVHFCYYPYSLTGIRELIVNSDGRIIPTNVMAMGKIPPELVFGNLLDHEKEASIVDRFTEKNAFSYYVNEFLQEKSLLS